MSRLRVSRAASQDSRRDAHVRLSVVATGMSLAMGIALLAGHAGTVDWSFVGGSPALQGGRLRGRHMQDFRPLAALDSKTEAATTVIDGKSGLAEPSAGTLEEADDAADSSSQWATAGMVLVALAALGFLDTAYLTSVKLAQVPLFCPSESSACTKVITSQYASVGPVPLAALGAGAYGTVGLLSASKDWAKKELLWWLTFAMCATSGALTLLLLFVIRAPCVYCAASAFISALLFAIVEAGSARQKRESPRGPVIGLASLVAVLALRVVTLEDENGWVALTERYKPDHPPLRSDSSPATVALAKHLKKIGAACYSAWWCPHCQEQREYFGKDAITFAPMVECAKLDRDQNDTCKEKDIQGYPAWIINGETYRGVYPLAELATISGFEEYPPEAFKAKPETTYDYIWE
eukprot:TRINITY_DN100674_c0_g1_i1.p1 TRINITY_DN100674_c0_g1~~TRINITY_DN100674_c0_g1_i1.p1  ORF type:complete len:408 (-),score=46.67 TRINITY_DN100674_c0_g1_i1:44-1267(-)